jgi:hypothetical protein
MAVEALSAMLLAAALAAALLLLLWAIARGSRRMLGNDRVANETVERCAACAQKPVCETGALAGWPGSHPSGCPNVEHLRGRP